MSTKPKKTQSLSEQFTESKRKFSLLCAVTKHQAEAATELQISYLWHHSSDSAQPLCTSLQCSLSGSCCKIWLLPREERGRQETTTEFPTDPRRFVIACWYVGPSTVCLLLKGQCISSLKFQGTYVLYCRIFLTLGSWHRGSRADFRL